MSTPSRKLLVVEDDVGLQSQLRWCFEQYEVLTAVDRSSAVAQMRRHEPPVVLQDLGLPPDATGVAEGMASLTEILKLSPYAKVIVITGNGDRESAVKAVGLGAFDFYHKPLDTGILALIVERAYRMFALEEENRRLLAYRATSPLEGLIATSERMLRICRLVEKVAPTNATVLLSGESGTGKELLARALHSLSTRAAQRFVAINCAAIPESLLESELFGYEKGAFTGAIKQTLGKIEHAHDGTLFLDEVGDMPLALQAKLLRFLQQRVVERIGGRQEIAVDVRVICATNQDLQELIKQGRFRQDLYYRINEVSVRIPPVRERDGDGVVLARALLEKYAEQHKRALRGFSADALRAIKTYPWPGNVRELENRINAAVILAEGKQVTARDLELDAKGLEPELVNLRQVRDQAEREAVQRALRLDDGNIARAAESLGISRPTLYDLMSKHGLK